MVNHASWFFILFRTRLYCNFRHQESSKSRIWWVVFAESSYLICVNYHQQMRDKFVIMSFHDNDDSVTVRGVDAGYGMWHALGFVTDSRGCVLLAKEFMHTRETEMSVLLPESTDRRPRELLCNVCWLRLQRPYKLSIATSSALIDMHVATDWPIQDGPKK